MVREQKANNEFCPVRTKTEGKPTAHWWVIEGQQGETATSKCKYCPATKLLRNGYTLAGDGHPKHEEVPE